jgi:cyclopropane-fatty-acyl-phospholipid synthase
LSNSKTQRIFIEAQARKENLTNLRIITTDINIWQPTVNDKFDRILSIEMLEHVKNYDVVLSKINQALANIPTSKAFIHVFCHANLPYHFQTGEAQSWMARYFFAGGTMPSLDLLPTYFHSDLVTEEFWAVSGLHYAMTARSWLQNLDEHEKEALPFLNRCYGASQGYAWLQRWRIFFMAVEELFGYRNGQEWMVGHYLLRKRVPETDFELRA